MLELILKTLDSMIITVIFTVVAFWGGGGRICISILVVYSLGDSVTLQTAEKTGSPRVPSLHKAAIPMFI